MEKYYLGLDMGTNSVGWAVTDENYNLIRKKDKDLWGVRLFTEAKTSADRRINRSSRRRNDRKKMRLQLLREIFEDEINKVDEKFYLRMDESKYWEDDKKVSGKYALFNDPKFTDKDYFKKYNTIFHLRRDLIKHSEKKDIRLYFLAINQMMKRRGHFLFAGEIKNITDYKPYMENLISIISEELDIDLDTKFYEDVFKIILDKFLTDTDKINNIKDLTLSNELEKDKSNRLNRIFELIVKGKSSVKNIFNDEEILERVKEDKKDKFDLSDEKYQENLEYFENLLGHRFQLIENLKAIYDFKILDNILDGHDYLSYAKVDSYEQHKKDLSRLKKLIRKYDSNNKVYNLIFRDKFNKNGYVAYLGYYNNKNKNIPVKICSYEEFTKHIKTELDKIVDKEDKDYLYIISKIEKEDFLLKQIVSTNTVIPHQIHLIELRKIIENLILDYPSFNIKEEDGFTKAEKIEKIFKFRIPYYVGPVNDYHKNKGANAWIVKNQAYQNEKIRPWNFEKVVDLHRSEEEFIKRMINECTYLPNEKVLPKSSLLYQEYMVLNELNNLKINNEPLKSELKKQIIEQVYKNNPKVTLKKIRNFLVVNNYIEDTKDIKFTGIDEKLNANLSSYCDFKNILKDKFEINMVEDIIEQITIHTGNIKLLSQKISEKYPQITLKQLKEIVTKSYKDWGRFSKKFLNGLEAIDKETGQVGTIIYFLRENNDNLNQILSHKYNFLEKIDEIRKSNLPKNLDYSVIDSLYVSPAVKKMIWQVININKELIKVLGKQPDKIFIEMARSKEDKPERKESRKSQLLKLYKSLQKDNKDLYQELNSYDDQELRKRTLYLYFTQMGKCIYSGKKIDLNKIFDSNLYDLDHIIPQSLKKDDSIMNNLVLVKKNINQTVKKNIYPVPDSIRNKKEIKDFWKMLFQKGLITKEKYDRLTRRDKLTDEELAGFISRQLVETRQSTKAVKELFEKYYTNSKIITVRAELTSELRRDYEILKCRELNDLHHAHDAFLNIIVGDIWNRKYTSNPINFVKENRNTKKGYSIKHIFKNNIEIRGKEVWNVASGKKKIIDILNKPSVLFSNESYEQKGELFNATIVSKNDIKDGGIYIPTKKDERLMNYKRYGAYGSIKNQSFYFIKNEKNKINIEGVPIYLKKYTEKDLVEYSKNILGYTNPIIIKPNIKFYSEIIINNFNYLLTSKTIGNQLKLKPFVQMFWNVEDTTYIKKLLNAYNKKISIDQKENLNILKLINKIIDKLNNKKSIFNHRFDKAIKEENFDDKTADELFDIFLDLNTKIKDKIYQPSSRNHSNIVIINKSITGIYEKREKI